MERVFQVLQAIGYELLPVHPAYAKEQVRWFAVNAWVLAAAVGGASVQLTVLLWATAARTSLTTWMGLVLWGTLLVASVTVELGRVYLVATGFALVFLNLGDTRHDGDMSAWSVFNKGFATMPGTTTAAMMDRAIRHRDWDDGDGDDEVEDDGG